MRTKIKKQVIKAFLLFVALFMILNKSLLALNPPSLYYPNNNETGIITYVTLKCYVESGITEPTQYQFEIDTTPDFDSPIHTISVGNVYNSYNDAIYKLNSDLLYGTTYYWRVRVFDAGDTSAWSAIWSFTTLNTVSWYFPEDNSIDISTIVYTKVNVEANNTDASHYQFEIDTTPDFNSPLHVVSTGEGYNSYSETIYKLNSNLLYGTKYYWRARVFNSNDTSEWSDVWNFTTLIKPTLYFPYDNYTGLSTTTYTEVNAEKNNTDELHYQFEMDTTPNFNSPLHILSFGDGYNSNLDYIYKENTGLLYGTTYFWRARVFNINDTSEWSDVWNFTTEYQLTEAPNLISPLNASTSIPLDGQVFEWSSIENVTSYQMMIAQDENFETNVVVYNSTDTFCVLNNLLPNTTYYWRVRGGNSSGYSPWSEAWYFTTESYTSFTANTVDNMIRIYPNPTTSKIFVKIPFNQKTIMKIYDVNGEEVMKATLQGPTRVSVESLPRGTYFYKIKIKDFIKTGKLIKK